MSGYERPLAPPCEKCDGDGYTESWNDDQSGVVIELCDCDQGRRIEAFDRTFVPNCDTEGS